MPPDPKILAAFDRLFAAMGVTRPEDKAAVVRQVFGSEALQQDLRALASRLVDEAVPGRPRPRKERP